MKIKWCENDRPLPWNFVPRRDMPQVDEDDLAALLVWLAFKGIAVESVTLDIDALRFHQHVDETLVETMPPEVYAKPILASNDGYVLDGNHRATAHKLKGEPIKALQIALPFEEAIAAIFSFAGTYDLAGRYARAKIRN